MESSIFDEQQRFDLFTRYKEFITIFDHGIYRMEALARKRDPDNYPVEKAIEVLRTNKGLDILEPLLEELKRRHDPTYEKAEKFIKQLKEEK